MGVEAGWKDLGPPDRAPVKPEVSGFARLARSHALAMGGDALVTMALAGSLFFSISPTAARGRVILSLVLTMAPFAIVAPFLGPLIDRARTGRRLMIVLTDLGRAVACLAMSRVIDGLLLFPAAFTILVLSKAYSVSKSSLVPAVVHDDDLLVEANSKLAIVGVLGGFAAAAPGVLLLRFADATWTLGLGALVFVAAGVTALRLPPARPDALPEARPEPRPDPEPHPEPRDASPARAEGRSRRTIPSVALHLTTAAVATALLRTMVGFLTFLVAFGFRRAGSPAWHFGVVLAASMVANLSGAAVAPRLRSRVSEEKILVGALACVGLAGVVVARFEGVLWAAAVSMAVGAAAAAGKLAFDAVVQRDAHDRVRGRSFARFEAGFQLVWVVGALLPVAIATPLRQGYDVLGISGIAGATAYALALRWMHMEGMRPHVTER